MQMIQLGIVTPSTNSSSQNVVGGRPAPESSAAEAEPREDPHPVKIRYLINFALQTPLDTNSLINISMRQMIPT